MTTIASATPGANRVPKADGTGKLMAGWNSAANLLTDLGLTGLTAGALIFASGAAAVTKLPIGPAGQLLVAGASAPAWSGTGLSYASGVLTVAGSVPGTPTTGQVLIGGGAIKAGGGVDCSALTARPATNQDGLRIQGRAAGTLGYNLTLTTVGALSADATVYLPTVTGATVMATTNSPSAGQIPFSAGTNYTMTLAGTLTFDSALLTLFVGLSTSTQNPVMHLAAGGSGSGTAKVRLGTNVREWEIKAGASPYSLSIDYVGTDAPLANILSLTKAGAALFGGTVTVQNGTASTPGIRTSENHGLYRFSSTELGFAAGGSAAGSVTSAGRWNLSCASVTSNPTVYSIRSLASATASASYECFTAQHNDIATETATWYNSTFRGKLDITGTGTNGGYDRGLTFEAYHRSTGTRAAVTGAYIEIGTYNGGSDSTGTITLMRGLHINAIKTTSSTISTSALIDLGSNVGTTKYAIRTASTSGIISIGDTTASSSITTGALTVAGGMGISGAIYYGGIGFQDLTDAATNAISDVQTFRHNGSAVATGFGSAFQWTLESSTTNNRNAARWTVEWADATDASRKARVVHYAYDTVARECMRMEGSGTEPLVGFLGATAVARQTIGAAATDAATTQTLANNIRTALISLGLCQN